MAQKGWIYCKCNHSSQVTCVPLCIGPCYEGGTQVCANRGAGRLQHLQVKPKPQAEQHHFGVLKTQHCKYRVV